MQPHLLLVLEDLVGVCVCPLPIVHFFIPKQAILSIKGLHPFIDRIIGGKSSLEDAESLRLPHNAIFKNILNPPTFVFCIQLWIRSVLYSP